MGKLSWFSDSGTTRGGPDDCWKNPMHQVLCEQCPGTGFWPWDKVLKFGDDFELQVGDVETHCTRSPPWQAVNAVKGARRNKTKAWKDREMVKLSPPTPPKLCLSIETLKLVCQICSIPVIIPPARNTGGKADFLVMSFWMSFTSSKDVVRALGRIKGKASLLFNQRKKEKKRLKQRKEKGKDFLNSTQIS